jgi:hypothetical protein
MEVWAGYLIAHLGSFEAIGLTLSFCSTFVFGGPPQ